MLNDYDALVDWIASEIGPKTVLAVGIGQAPLISALVLASVRCSQ